MVLHHQQTENNPLVSIIIPTYNRAGLIGETLQSVINQTYTNWECIVVDDGSTDKTKEVVERKAYQEKRIKFLTRNRKPKGAQTCRNIGINAAKGDWIAFLDSDDLYLPHKLETQINLLKALKFNKYTFLHGNVNLFDTAKNFTKLFEIPAIEGEKPIDKLLQHPGPLFPTILVHKERITEKGFLDEKVRSNQEWDFSIEMSKVCNFHFITEPLVLWRQHSGEQISKTKGFAGYRYIVNKHKQLIIDRLGNQALDFHFWIMANRAFRQKRKTLAVYFLNQIQCSYFYEGWLLRRKLFCPFTFLSNDNFLNKIQYKLHVHFFKTR